MFWLNIYSSLLFEYRLITINVLIYNLIATEIVNVNAHIVAAVSGMTEFDKSATVQMARTSTKIASEILSDTYEMQSLTKAPTTTATKANKDRAELAVLGKEQWSELESDDETGDNNNNNFSNNNLEFANVKRSAPTNNSFPIPVQAMNVIVAASTAKPRPFLMMTDNCNHFDNGISIMPTINERVDNFQNDKKQIASATATTQTTTAAVIAQQNENAMTGVLTTPCKTKATTTLLGPATIKTNIITAIKSTATPFTTITSTLTSTSSSTATESLLDSTIATNIKPTTSTYAARTSATKSIASITMSKMPTPTTRTTQTPHALLWWPSLHGHDLLSSTNRTPNCRVTPPCRNISEQRQDATNRKRQLRSTEALESSAAPPPTSMCSDKGRSATKTMTTKMRTKQKSCSETHVKSSIGRERVKAMANIKSGEKRTKSSSNNNAGNTKFVPETTTAALHTLPKPLSNGMSSNKNTASNSTTRTIMGTKTPDSTSALQTHWRRILSRRKRYLAFPEGSSFSVALCITVGIIGNPNYSYMSFGINWGVSYDLPNATWVLNQLHGLTRRPTPSAVLHRRSKRTLYDRIGETVENMGYNGRECVLRALCESRQYFTRNKMGMLGEMLRVIFSLPKQRLFTRELHESSDIAVYDHAYRKARETDCATQYQCAFSLLELAFGKYAKPPTDYYDNKSGM